mmetsp:Transcript_12371/g.29463  ORF Transcript_12371/g.29463 Transcript_12371/m.29463 type:complete len:145 (-) Transcript_12371:73-507(-)
MQLIASFFVGASAMLDRSGATPPFTIQDSISVDNGNGYSQICSGNDCGKFFRKCNNFEVQKVKVCGVNAKVTAYPMSKCNSWKSEAVGTCDTAQSAESCQEFNMKNDVGTAAQTFTVTRCSCQPGFELDDKNRPKFVPGEGCPK